MLEKTEEPMEFWHYLYNYMTSFKHLDFLFKIKDFPLIGNYARNYINRHLAFTY